MTGFEVGFMSNLWRPRPEENDIYYFKDKSGKKKAVGWKFYYNMKYALDKGEGNGVPAQVAFKNDEFITQLNFRNLKSEELGALLIALGQDNKYPIILKLGAGKPVGLGSMIVEITEADLLQNQSDLRTRYSSFERLSNQFLTGESLKIFIGNTVQKAHENLIDKSKLEELSNILNPSTHFAPHESY